MVGGGGSGGAAAASNDFMYCEFYDGGHQVHGVGFCGIEEKTDGSPEVLLST